MSGESTSSTKWQSHLLHACSQRQMRSPTYQVLSDRRGGRTAWSSVVTIEGQQIQARYWYDGKNVNNAKEDAAEVALQHMGVRTAPYGPSPAAPQNGWYGAIGQRV